MMADHVLVPGKKSIGLHLEAFIFQLHDERSAQVYQISVSYVWEKCIRKTFGIALIEFIKICFPEKINELGKRRFCFPAVIAVFEMISMKKFYMLHLLKLMIALAMLFGRNSELTKLIADNAD